MRSEANDVTVIVVVGVLMVLATVLVVSKSFKDYNGFESSDIFKVFGIVAVGVTVLTLYFTG